MSVFCCYDDVDVEYYFDIDCEVDVLYCYDYWFVVVVLNGECVDLIVDVSIM